MTSTLRKNNEPVLLLVLQEWEVHLPEAAHIRVLST